jgi:hypothetical protein
MKFGEKIIHIFFAKINKVAVINWGFDGCICSFTWQHVAEPVKQISAIKS